MSREPVVRTLAAKNTSRPVSWLVSLGSGRPVLLRSSASYRGLLALMTGRTLLLRAATPDLGSGRRRYLRRLHHPEPSHLPLPSEGGAAGGLRTLRSTSGPSRRRAGCGSLSWRRGPAR